MNLLQCKVALAPVSIIFPSVDNYSKLNLSFLRHYREGPLDHSPGEECPTFTILLILLQGLERYLERKYYHFTILGWSSFETGSRVSSIEHFKVELDNAGWVVSLRL